MNLAPLFPLAGSLTHGAVTEHLGWALLHFVWQGALIALAYAVLRPLLRRASPQAKYAAAAVSLLGCAAAFAVTLILLPVPAPSGLQLEGGITPKEKKPAPSAAAVNLFNAPAIFPTLPA